MGFLDKAKEFAGKNPDKVDSAVEKAGDMFDEKTGGQHAQHTDMVQEKAGDFLTGGAGEAPAEGQPGEQPPAEDGQAPA